MFKWIIRTKMRIKTFFRKLKQRKRLFKKSSKMRFNNKKISHYPESMLSG